MGNAWKVLRSLKTIIFENNPQEWNLWFIERCRRIGLSKFDYSRLFYAGWRGSSNFACFIQSTEIIALENCRRGVCRFRRIEKELPYDMAYTFLLSLYPVCGSVDQ